MKKNKTSKVLSILLALAMMAAMAVFAASCSGNEASEDASGEPAQEESEEQYESGIEAAKIGEFDTVDLNGNQVTQDIFQQADLTLINFWGTFCGPCIAEMPDLQALSEEYEGRVTFLGVVTDMEDLSDSELNEEAEKITAGQGVKFASIIPAGDLYDLVYSLQYVPTTIIVDREGNIVGDPVVGASVKQYKAMIDSCFSDK